MIQDTLFSPRLPLLLRRSNPPSLAHHEPRGPWSLRGGGWQQIVNPLAWLLEEMPLRALSFLLCSWTFLSPQSSWHPFPLHK